MQELYRAHAPSLVRQLARRTGCRELARELAQDAFVKLLRMTPATLARVEQPEAYVRRMSFNLLHDWGRSTAAADRATPTLEVMAADQVVDQVAVLESRETLRRLERAVARMKPRTREIFLAHRVEGMLADAIAYAIGLAAMSRGPRFKANAAGASGFLLLALGLGVLADAARRALFGDEPDGWIMMLVACVALIVNSTVLRMLSKQQNKEVHIRATVIFTRVDVIANIAVILSGAIVVATGFRFIDLLVGAAIGIYIVKESFEILGDARAARGK